MLHGPRESFLEVYSETQLDSDDASSSCDDYVDPNALNEELSEFS